MNKTTLKATAKINLSLDILGKREDGYHEMEMVMQSIALHDKITISLDDSDAILLKSNISWLPLDERNLAYKAAKYIKETYNIEEGINIYINKRVPVAAGLGGGSSDFAAVLFGLNRLLNLRLTKKQMIDIGVKFGADIPFCIKRGTLLAKGIGENLSMVPRLPDCHIVVAKPQFGFSTKKIFELFDLQKVERHPDTKLILELLKNKDLKGICENMVNVLETPAFSLRNVISDIKNSFLELGALGSLMCGSGPSVFAVFDDKEKAQYAAMKISKKYNIREIFVTENFVGNNKE